MPAATMPKAETQKTPLLSLFAIGLILMEVFGHLAFDSWRAKDRKTVDENDLLFSVAAIFPDGQCGQTKQRALSD
jgi:hypothetical protein